MSELYNCYVISEYYNGVNMGLVNRKGQADKYDVPRTFGTLYYAKKWIHKHSYKGMSHYYKVFGVIGSVYYNDRVLVCKYDQKEDKTEWEQLHPTSKTSTQR